jgi:hypothetical protein
MVGIPYAHKIWYQGFGRSPVASHCSCAAIRSLHVSRYLQLEPNVKSGYVIEDMDPCDSGRDYVYAIDVQWRVDEEDSELQKSKMYYRVKRDHIRIKFSHEILDILDSNSELGNGTGNPDQ